MSIIEYYKTLFDPEDKVCWGATKYDTASRPIRYVEVDEQFVCLNALKGTRADANVTKFRNILIEFDKTSLEQQLADVRQIPYSTLVFSGSKSHHAVISLEDPIPDETTYRRVVATLYERIKTYQPDTSAINPSRFTRAPEAYRAGNVVQSLLEVKGRVKNADFFAWLGPLKPEPKLKPVVRGTRILPISAVMFLKHGVAENRNRAVFKNACIMLRAGYSIDECISLCSEAVDLSFKELRATIKSAAKIVAKEIP